MFKSKKTGWKYFIVLMVLFAQLAACTGDSAIVHDLNERDANEIWVLLSKNNIVAKKSKVEKNQEVSWTISVKSSDEMEARNLLVANNLPRVRQGGLESICGIKVGTFILTPKQEKCREVLGKKGDVINMLEQLPGVVSAEVVLNLPEKETFPDENTPQPRPTAAVVIRFLDNGIAVTKLSEGKIQELVSGSIDGLDPRDVNVVISQLDYNGKLGGKTATATGDDTATTTDESLSASTDEGDENSAELTKVAGLNLDSDSARKLKVIGGLFLFLFLVMAVAFILVLLKLSGLRKQAPVQATPAAANDADQKLLEA